jgi:hypothetical protein
MRFLTLSDEIKGSEQFLLVFGIGGWDVKADMGHIPEPAKAVFSVNLTALLLC